MVPAKNKEITKEKPLISAFTQILGVFYHEQQTAIRYTNNVLSVTDTIFIKLFPSSSARKSQ
jgi:hypothetical protein